MTPDDIKQARSALGLTQTKFGELLHAKLRTVQAWEAGKRKMQAVTVELLERKLQEKENGQ
jgi:DNA-binding transcriptional regulator YiaG